MGNIRDQFLFEASCLRATEKKLYNLFTAKIIRKNIPFGFALLTFNIFASLVVGRIDHFLRSLAAISIIELIIHLAYIGMLDHFIYSKMRILICEYINKKYKGRCDLAFTKNHMALIKLSPINNGLLETNQEADLIKVPLRSSQIDGYIEIFLNIEFTLGNENE